MFADFADETIIRFQERKNETVITGLVWETSRASDPALDAGVSVSPFDILGANDTARLQELEKVAGVNLTDANFGAIYERVHAERHPETEAPTEAPPSPSFAPVIKLLVLLSWHLYLVLLGVRHGGEHRQFSKKGSGQSKVLAL